MISLHFFGCVLSLLSGWPRTLLRGLVLIGSAGAGSRLAPIVCGYGVLVLVWLTGAWGPFVVRLAHSGR